MLASPATSLFCAVSVACLKWHPLPVRLIKTWSIPASPRHLLCDLLPFRAVAGCRSVCVCSRLISKTTAHGCPPPPPPRFLTYMFLGFWGRACSVGFRLFGHAHCVALFPPLERCFSRGVFRLLKCSVEELINNACFRPHKPVTKMKRVCFSGCSLPGGYQLSLSVSLSHLSLSELCRLCEALVCKMYRET